MPERAQSAGDCWNRIGVRGDSSCPELERHVHCHNCPVYSAAALRLLDRQVPADYRAERTLYFSSAQSVEALGTQPVLIFRIGAEWLALSVRVLIEVAELRPIHSLPHRRSGAVLGVVNVRGELLVCIALGKLLGLEEAVVAQAVRADAARQRAARRRLLVLEHEGARMAVPIDEAHGLYRIHEEELKAVPSTVARATATYTRAILAWGEKTVGCLDDQLLFHTLNRSFT